MISPLPAELNVEYRPLAQLAPFPQNARTHSKHQIRQIADSISAFGFTNPVLIDERDTIIAGHGRVAAAALLGFDSVPTIRREHLSKEQVRAYVLADNKLAENAGWDKSILAIELQHLIVSSEIPDATLTGFEVPEIDLIIQSEMETAEEQEPEVAILSVPVTQQGDLWQLGAHRVFCGSSLEERQYRALFNGKRANAVFSDPPFNLKINGHVSGNGQVRHSEFAMASGEMTEAEFVAFLATSLGLMAKYSTPGALHYVCIDFRHQFELLQAGKSVYDGDLLNVCVWVKNTGGMGSFYRSRHELVFVYRNSGGKHRNNIHLGRYGRNRTNVWEYPNASTFSKTGEEGNLLALHPTVKPVAMVADAVLDCTKRGDIVLVPRLRHNAACRGTRWPYLLCHRTGSSIR
jgi:hypothetical protein